MKPEPLREGVGALVHPGCGWVPCGLKSVHVAWPEAEFHIVEGAGHAWSEPGILDKLIRATDRFAT